MVKFILGVFARIVDIETAFFHGSVRKEIYMNVLEGLNVNCNECLSLKKTIYGLVQNEI
jgi:hypothetical protein